MDPEVLQRNIDALTLELKEAEAKLSQERQRRGKPTRNKERLLGEPLEAAKYESRHLQQFRGTVKEICQRSDDNMPSLFTTLVKTLRSYDTRKHKPQTPSARSAKKRGD